MSRQRRVAALAAAAITALWGVSAAAATTSAHPATLLSGVAAGLGIPPARLESAVRSAELQRWKAYASTHDVPAQRAAEIEQRIERQPLTLIARFGPSGGMGLLQAAAAYLGLSPQELGDRLREGKSLAEVAAAQGKSSEGCNRPSTPHRVPSCSGGSTPGS